MDWYIEVNSETSISQGDIILGCPIVIPNHEFSFTSINELENIGARVYSADVIIMTQACDLAHNPDPLDSIVVARILDISDFNWNDVSGINSGRMPAYHLISSKENGNIEMNYKIVDFTSIYTIPLALLQNQTKRHEYRLRLNSPYLELLAQRFGYFFSRIGLPRDISKKELQISWKNINEIKEK